VYVLPAVPSVWHTADNITLDGNGFTIDGNDTVLTYGVTAASQDNLTIKNFKNITDFDRGIYFTNTNNSLITNNTANSNTNSGILLDSSSSNNQITNNTANSNTNYGIHMFSSSNNNTITNNNLSLNSDSGIRLSSSSNNNTITNNTANLNSANGIGLDSSSNNNIITNNTANNNTDGISISNTLNNTITNNTATSNSNAGIILVSTNNSLITNNTANSNSNGIRLSTSSNNTVTNNTANSNSGDGFLLQFTSNNNQITDNTASSNPDGIRLDTSSDNNTLINNKLTENTNWAIFDTTTNSTINYLIYNNSFGEIRWIDDANGSFLKDLDFKGNIALGINLTIENNTVFLNAGAFTSGQINSSANITLYGMDSFSFTDPTIFRNGIECGSDCVNLTALNIATVKFNVTYAGANYSIGDAGDITICQTLGIAGRTYTLQNDISINGSTCFTITADNITLDGNGFTIDGDDTSNTRGVVTSGARDNLTIKNFKNITDFNRGISFTDTNNSLITNNTATSNTAYGIFLKSSSSNTITNNTANLNSNTDILLQFSSNNNQITNNTIVPAQWGIFIQANSDNNQVTNNNVSSGSIGIRLSDSLNNTITNNTVTSNTNGFLISSANDSLITSNTLNSNGRGIRLDKSSSNNQILNNQITDGNTIDIKDDTGNSFINYLIYNNSFGEIRWINDTNGGFLKNLSLIGNIDLGINLSIGNNTVFLNAGAFTLGQINSSANITLYGMDSFSFTDPVIFRNGVECGSDCVNSTPLNDSTVKFNVTYAGANYTIGEAGEITVCQTLGTAGKTYTLQNDISINGSTCFTITADNITLDGNGFTIDGNDTDSTNGVTASSRDNLTIKNFRNITDFGRGIDLIVTTNSLITNNNASSNVNDGIRLFSSANNNQITNNTVNSNSDAGIRLSSSSNNNQITNNTFNLNTDGIALSSSSNNTLTNNTANNNTQEGISLSSSSNNNTITNNNASLNDDGIRLSSSSNNTITDNTANLNTGQGIALSPTSNNNTIKNNTANSNSRGIFLSSSSSNTITDNTLNSNTDYGIRLQTTSSNNQFLNNLITGNTLREIQDLTSNSEINYIIYNNSFGEIRWINDTDGGFLKNLSLIGNIGLGINLTIGNNTAFVDVAEFTLGQINSSANITLRGMDSFIFAIPAILRNGIECGSDCSNFTPLNASTVKFNVTYAGANYTIGEGGDITSCQTLGTAGATYTLQNDILQINGSTCFTITADNITLDGNGFTIDGNDTSNTYGVNTTGIRDNLTIKNFFNITDFQRGIYFSNTNNSLITNNTANSVTFYGISLESSSNNIITNNNVSSNSNSGIRLDTSSNNNTITNNTANSNTFYGINLDTSSNNTITNNTANSNSNSGILLDSSSSNNQITDNIANLNTLDGILIFFSLNNTITNNTANSNGQVGILLSSSSSDNQITNNTANLNGIYGISLQSSSNNIITNNTFNSNNDTGIRLQSTSSNNQLLNNLITGNTLQEISDDTGNSTINHLIYNNSFGEIRWIDTADGGFLKNLTLIGNIDLGINSTIGNNTVFLNAGAFTLGQINSSANITLYGMDSFSFTSPIILRNGVDCGTDCVNSTPLNASTVKFNVTYAGANYTIGDAANTAPTITFVSNISNTDPTEAGVTNVEFFITMTDTDGVADLNDSSVTANFTFSSAGEATRENTTCVLVGDLDSKRPCCFQLLS